jgi:hypothetical protein
MNGITKGLVALFVFILAYSTEAQKPQLNKLGKQIAPLLKEHILVDANIALTAMPITVTAESCDRSAGGKHDFYSEGDYWWPDPQNPSGPYIQRDGETNPNNFNAHRLAMIRFSKIIGSLASAYLLTDDDKYIDAAFKHLDAWFIDTATSMNPSLLYAQAIKGKATGRGIGIIDMIQMVEAAQGLKIFASATNNRQKEIKQITAWFEAYLTWVTTHQYGIDERDAKNNHGTCWMMQVVAFAKITSNGQLIQDCEKRFLEIFLPNQFAIDGSFPLELKRTKPYGYSLFNLDAMSVICEILSRPSFPLWNFQLKDGRGMEKAFNFMLPYVEDKSTWTYPKDIMYWDAWPVAHPFLLFGYQAYGNKEMLDTWKKLEHFPTEGEVIRNLPIRNPLIWLMEK